MTIDNPLNENKKTKQNLKTNSEKSSKDKTLIKETLTKDNLTQDPLITELKKYLKK